MATTQFLVTGMFRSGTTFCARVLNANRHIICASDPFAPIFKAYRNIFGQAAQPGFDTASPLHDYYFDAFQNELFERMQASSFDVAVDPSALAGLVDMFFPTQTSFAVVNNLILAAIAALLAVIVLTLREGDLNARWVALGFLPILVATLFPVLRNFGLIASGFFTEYGLILGSAIEMPILFIGLQRRLNQRSEAQGRARALSQTDPLTGLVQRRVFYHRLKGSLMRAKRYNHSCALLVVGVANHRGLLRERGREAAEKALVLAASQLRSLVRDVDTAARVGDQQFALLIEGPTSLQRAQDLATRAVASPALRAVEPISG